jgi:hypothetical protein
MTKLTTLLVLVACGGSQAPAPVVAPVAPAEPEPTAPSETHGDPATRRNATIIEAKGPSTLWSDAGADGKLVAVAPNSRPNQAPGRMVIALTPTGVCGSPCTVYDHSLAGEPQRATYVTWEPYAADRRFARLWGNLESGPFGVLVEVKAGSSPFWHMHGRDVRMVVLAGTVEYLESGQPTHTLTPGSYVYQPGGYKHSESCKPGADCVVYMHGDRGFDVKPL